MKKTIVSLTATIALVFTGCFIDSDTATVRINLGNIPVAKVEKKSIFDRIVMLFVKEAVAMDDNPPETGLSAVHIGAFDSNNQLLTKKTILLSDYLIIYNNDNIVDFLVPARSGVTIVVIGEGDYYGDAKMKFYGKTLPLNLIAGVTYNEQINMHDFEFFLNLRNNIGLSRMEWDKITGASDYLIYSGGQEFIERAPNGYFYGSYGGAYYLEIEFSFIGKESYLIYHNFSW